MVFPERELRSGSVTDKKTPMEKTYWTHFYSDVEPMKYPSQFAVFVMQDIEEDAAIVDLGAGDLRDSLFFSQHIPVLALDQHSPSPVRLTELKGIEFVPANLSIRSEYLGSV